MSILVSYDGRNRYTRLPNRNNETRTSLTSVQSPAAYDEQISAALLHVFFPRSSDHWLYDAVAAMPFSDPLTLSLRAFSLSRIGFADKNQTLIVQSFATYTKALRSVRSCVSAPSSTVDEGTATAVSVLSLFEVRNISPAWSNLLIKADFQSARIRYKKLEQSR